MKFPKMDAVPVGCTTTPLELVGVTPFPAITLPGPTVIPSALMAIPAPVFDSFAVPVGFKPM